MKPSRRQPALPQPRPPGPTYADAVVAFGGPFLHLDEIEGGAKLTEEAFAIVEPMTRAHLADTGQETVMISRCVERDGSLLIVVWFVIEDRAVPEAPLTNAEVCEKFETLTFILAKVVPAGGWRKEST